jgi:hypothetical protein
MRAPLLFAAVVAGGRVAAETAWVTPHDSYSSSVGVAGCHINTDRVAYWPMAVDCNNVCVKLSHEGRSVFLLRIDQSGGAYDVSYDAWNYLMTGESATRKPTAGGATAMEYENVEPWMCAPLIYTDGAKLPLSAANSMNYLAACLAEPDSFVARNYVLYNILDSICSWGYDETCTLDLAKSNQASCPHGLGTPSVLTGAPVYNIKYPSGDRVLASSGQVTAGPSGSGAAPRPTGGSLPVVLAFGASILVGMLVGSI